jgi:hypothetical protein
MIETIRIGTLLRETAATPYHNLITRPAGAAVRDRIEAALAESRCLIALLDFSDIGVIDFSGADEAVAKLLLAATGPGRPVVVLQGLREDQHEAIERVLIHHELAVIVVPCADGGSMPQLIGCVTPDGREAFGCLCECGAQQSFHLARTLGWSESRAQETLRALLERRLVHGDGDIFLPITIA